MALCLVSEAQGQLYLFKRADGLQGPTGHSGDDTNIPFLSEITRVGCARVSVTSEGPTHVRAATT
jgi:hypothetical protein